MNIHKYILVTHISIFRRKNDTFDKLVSLAKLEETNFLSHNFY